ncbi:MFS transporter, partial [Mesorhizobium sp. M8A.F.Ca.ET.173.01.1.1]
MTMTFIIVYVVIALILVGGLNFFIVKRNKQKSTQKMEQSKYENIASNESYQSKFKVKDDNTTTKNQEQNKGETTEEKAEKASHTNSDAS